MENELFVDLSKRIVSHAECFINIHDFIPEYLLTDKNDVMFEPKNSRSLPNILDDDDIESEDNNTFSENDIVPGFIDSNILTERGELKRKLREKLNVLRAKRKAPPVSEDPNETLEEPLAKKRKMEERKKNNTEKKNISRKKQQQNKNMKPTPVSPSPKTGTSSATTSPSPKPLSQSNKQNSKNTDDSTIEFATFDFSGGNPVPTYLKNKKKISKQFLLKQAQERRKKIHDLKGTEEGESLVSQEAWSTMKKRASGQKVFNDPEKIKKSLKREQHQKKKSQKEWSARINTQNKVRKDAQKKRSENIAAAKERKRNNKSPKKRNREKRPGFEGVKSKIINK